MVKPFFRDDLIVYLHASPETSSRRLQARGRNDDDLLSMDHLCLLRAVDKKWYEVGLCIRRELIMNVVTRNTNFNQFIISTAQAISACCGKLDVSFCYQEDLDCCQNLSIHP
jgi:deoxyadenosine/deoxycytidine kinase